VISLIQKLQESRFLRFGIVGAAGFLVNEAALFFALHVIGLNAYSGALFSFFVAVTFTWWGNRMLTFRNHAATGLAGVATEWATFAAANGLGFGVNYAVYAALIGFAPWPLDNPFVALFCGTLAGFTLNFILSKKLVFRAP
jgi:putative flippase GtrA